jgi:hypothetical protein
MLGAARAHDDDRGADSLGPRGLDDPPAVHAGQHEVEHADVRLLVAKAREPCLALVHPQRIEPGGVQVARHSARDHVVVLDDENLRHVSADDALPGGVGVVNKS